MHIPFPFVRYGVDCYRHDKRHFEEFRHPHLPTTTSEQVSFSLEVPRVCWESGGSNGGWGCQWSPRKREGGLVMDDLDVEGSGRQTP